MEILNSGSFIPLDNSERIEQLIFTAQTLASEVGKNAGFQSSGQTNQQIGLELWKGAEYMTRSHEEVTIRNIFLSKFLERLREIESDQNHQPTAAESPQASSVKEVDVTPQRLVSAPSQVESEAQAKSTSDEFLGVIEDTLESKPSYADECVPECEEEIASILSSKAPSTIANEAEEAEEEREPTIEIKETVETVESGAPLPTENVTDQSLIESTLETQENARTPDEPEDPKSETEVIDKQSVSSVIISDQEPFNFDACTITAVIQLLPESGGHRDCVVSVRSHDFAPQIIFTTTDCESGSPDLLAHLSSALDQYRAALPVLAAAKMKKEKSQAKKRTSKPAEKTSTPASEKVSVAAPSAVPEQAKDQQALFSS